jgi:aryl-alcohol dehydrogenase-like predicted oxidoreductase
VAAAITGPGHRAYLEDALAVVDVKLDPELARALDEIVLPGSGVASFHFR